MVLSRKRGKMSTNNFITLDGRSNRKRLLELPPKLEL